MPNGNDSMGQGLSLPIPESPPEEYLGQSIVRAAWILGLSIIGGSIAFGLCFGIVVGWAYGSFDRHKDWLTTPPPISGDQVPNSAGNGSTP